MRVKCHTRNRGYDAVSQPRPRGAAHLRDEGGLEPGYAISLLAAEGDSRGDRETAALGACCENLKFPDAIHALGHY